MMHGQAKSDNEIYLLIRYIKSVLWRVVKRLSYIEKAGCLKVKQSFSIFVISVVLNEIVVLGDNLKLPWKVTVVP